MSGTLVGGMFDARTEGTSGVTGVWAEENTRASIFDALQRKETFGVSGPHCFRQRGPRSFVRAIHGGGCSEKNRIAE